MVVLMDSVELLCQGGGVKNSMDDPKTHCDEDGESDEQHREEEVFSWLDILTNFSAFEM